jgi:hypothetical protein
MLAEPVEKVLKEEVLAPVRSYFSHIDAHFQKLATIITDQTTRITVLEQNLEKLRESHNELIRSLVDGSATSERSVN